MTSTFQRMARLVLGTVVAGAALIHGAAQAGSDVGVSVSVRQPGFYGRVQIGDRPPPVVYSQPVIIQQTPVAMVQQPIYMHVPPGHYKRWNRYCGRYRACGQPVYFVQQPVAVPVAVHPGHGHRGRDHGRWDRDHDGRRDHHHHHHYHHHRH